MQYKKMWWKTLRFSISEVWNKYLSVKAKKKLLSNSSMSQDAEFHSDKFHLQRDTGEPQLSS